jgi:hypothetical protein
MSRAKGGVSFPLTFEDFSSRFILRITTVAQQLLLQKKPEGNFHIPFINKNKENDGCYASFKDKEMADEVIRLVDEVKSCDFHDGNTRLVLNLFHHCIQEEDEKNFIYHIEDKDKTILLFHPDEGVAEKTISKMTEMLEKYMIPHPIFLISQLLPSCAVTLSEQEMLIISCGMKTFLKPILHKEAPFKKAFSKTLSRVTKKTVACAGMDFYEVKDICKEIDIQGVYFYITPEHVELTGLQDNVKNFSDILKRRLKNHPREVRVLSRK